MEPITKLEEIKYHVETLTGLKRTILSNDFYELTKEQKIELLDKFAEVNRSINKWVEGSFRV